MPPSSLPTTAAAPRRRRALAAAVRLLALTLALIGATAPQAGASVPVHVPVATATYQRAIDIDASSHCASGRSCAMALWYRTTPLSTSLQLFPSTAGWSRVAMTDRGRTPLPAVGGDLVQWRGQIPAAGVSTTGVDYWLEESENGVTTRFPLAASLHVQTLSPPIVAHVPPVYATSDTPLPLTLEATCSTGNCVATVWYRTAPESGQDITLGQAPDWPHTTMSLSATTDLGNLGKQLTFRASVPASYVNTRGVDYVFRVSDGETTAWSPGTTYQGYLPADGVRGGHYHAHVVEPPRLVHVPPVTASYRQEIPITARANCPATRSCEARLSWRTTTRSLLSAEPDFESAPMQVTRLTGAGSSDLVELTGKIPSRSVDTRGVDYFLSIGDGATQAWWPGTSHIDGYVAIPGTRVLWQHVRVLEPPHVVPVHTPVTQPSKPYTIRALVTCATEQCSVVASYRQSLLNGAPFKPLTMQPEGPVVNTPAGAGRNYVATIPAAEVTTRGLSYAIRAFDGYSATTMPGTLVPGVTVDDLDFGAQAGALLGQELALPVRVLEPPHVIHVPGIVRPDQPYAVEAYATCAFATCTAKLEWQRADGTWGSVDAPGAKNAVAGLTLPIPPDVGSVWRFTATIPRDDTGGTLVSYRLVVDDGYVAEASPTYLAPITDKGASIGGRVEFRDASGDVPELARTMRSGTLVRAYRTYPIIGRRMVAEDRTDAAGRYVLSDLLPGDYSVEVDPATLHEAADRLAQPLTKTVNAGLLQRVRDVDFPLAILDKDHDDLLDYIEPSLGLRAGTDADTDDDTLLDGYEAKRLMPLALPSKADTDADGIRDDAEDLDADRVATGTERTRGSDPLQADADADDLDDGEEHARSTRPDRADTDNDGLDDGAESRSSTEPRDPDSDDDGILDGQDTTTSTVRRDGVEVALTGRGDLSGALSTTRLAGNAVPPSGGLGQVGDAWDIHLGSAAEAGFASAKVTLRAPAAYTGVRADLRVFTYDRAQQVWLPSSRSQQVGADGTVTATVDHFSVYTLFDIKTWRERWTTTVDGCDKTPPVIDLSIVFDVGESTASRDPGGLRKQIARRFVDALGANDRVSIAEVDDSYTTRQGLTSDKGLAYQGIDRVVHYGRPTDMSQLLHGGLAPLKAGGPRQLNRVRVMIVLTSGYDGYHEPPEAMNPALDDAALGNVRIFPISVGATPNEPTLKFIAEGSDGSWHHVADAAGVPDIAQRVTRHDGQADMDDDNVHDCDEAEGIRTTHTDELLFTSPTNPDSDDDGIEDGEELGLRKKTSDVSAYGTTLSDEVGVKRVYAAESDPSRPNSDPDQLDDMEEYELGSSAWLADSDGEGLDDLIEREIQTDPNFPDTDFDDMSDKEEDQKRDLGFDPLSYNEKVNKLVYVVQFGRGASGGLLGKDSDSIPYLVGNVTGGFVGLSDIGEIITSLADGNSVAAGTALVGLVPVLGDAKKSGKALEDFVEENPEKADDAYRAVFGVDKVPPSTRDELLQVAAKACRAAPGALVAAAAGGCADPARLARLRGYGLSDDLLLKLARGKPSDLAHLEDVLKGATRVLKRGDADWLPPATTWVGAEQQVKQKYGAGKRFRLARARNRHADSYDAPKRTIHESKRGYQCGGRLNSEVKRDRMVMQEYPDDVEDAVWHFFVSDFGPFDKRANLGPCKSLLDELKGHPGQGVAERPIDYVIYLP